MAKRYGVLIGVEDYQDFERTRFCHADVDLLLETLVNHLDFAEHDLLVKRLDQQNPSSPDEILRDIEARVSGAQAGDTVLFYFAGHGDRIGGESYLMLPATIQGDYERTALPLRSVNDRMRTNERLNVRIFDACRSGPDARSPGLKDQVGFMRHLGDIQEGWVTLAACNEDQKSYGDASLGSGGNGVFTHYLCEAIRELPEAREVGPAILYDAVCSKVQNHVVRTKEFQTPVLSGHIVGNLPFAVRKRRPAPAAASANAGSPQPVADRLAKLKSFPQVGGKEHHAALQATADKLLAAVKGAQSTIVSHGLATSTGPLVRVDALEGRVKRSIVAHIAEKRFLTCHTSEKRTNNGPFGNLALITGHGPTVEYILRQPSDWPASTVLTHVTTDTYLPQAVFFHYLCPLQIKCILFAGFMIAGPSDSLYEGDMTWWVNPVELPSDGELEAVVAQIVADFNLKFTKAVEARLTDLEREHSLS